MLLKSVREKDPFFRKCNLAGDGNDAPLSRSVALRWLFGTRLRFIRGGRMRDAPRNNKESDGKFRVFCGNCG